MTTTRMTQTVRIPGTTMRLGDLAHLIDRAQGMGAGATAEVTVATTPGDRPFDPAHTTWTVSWNQPRPLDGVEYQPHLRVCFHCGKSQADHADRWESCPVGTTVGTTFSPKRPL